MHGVNILYRRNEYVIHNIDIVFLLQPIAFLEMMHAALKKSTFAIIGLIIIEMLIHIHIGYGPYQHKIVH